jgi:hypothetical protein
MALLLTSGMVTSKRRLGRDTANSSNSTASTKPRWKPGRRGYPFFLVRNKTAPSNSCSWGYKMKRTIEIIIGTTGEIQIDAVGFKGPDCEKATAFLEEALGVVGKKVKKTEYHLHGTTTNQQRVGG